MMVGEEKSSVRNRWLTSKEKDEEKTSSHKEETRQIPEETPQTPGNGQFDSEQCLTRKILLTAEAEQLKPFFMKEVGNQFDEFVTNLIDKSTSLDISGSATSFAILNGGKNNHRARDLRNRPEQGKLFVVRRSMLDELLEVNHIRTIYHMFIALLILFILSTLVVDYIDEGRLVLEFSLFTYAFGKFPVVICTWWIMFLSTLIIPYLLFEHWAKGYATSSRPILHSCFYGMLFMLFQIVGLGCGSTYIVLTYMLPPASRFIVILEQVRFIMKAHSFIRENVPRVLDATKEKSRTIPIPQVNQYLYFLFAPTLIYRDSYPRNPTIRWSYVATQFAQPHWMTNSFPDVVQPSTAMPYTSCWWDLEHSSFISVLLRAFLSLQDPLWVLTSIIFLSFLSPPVYLKVISLSLNVLFIPLFFLKFYLVASLFVCVLCFMHSPQFVNYHLYIPSS
ncbi:sterol O-acyltransferase 1 isoform X2 [Antechinus flavipes]|uniref:sterol O-acyltransferase 1 isoform X2 n=1 Tax=Antechinus flavipes TaxID=38775 RepID=UPI002235F2AC|nr:sterol O-acyltransferase 1 isoform X2 [Antechinus flavipes]